MKVTDSTLSAALAPADQTGMDFSAQVKEGMRVIEALSGHEWTNYNPVDPGVTLLEYICYAITDLSYRLNFPIADLLTDVNGKDGCGASFNAESVFSCSPVTLNDYRSLLSDIPGVRYVRIGKSYLPGLYKVEVQTEKHTTWSELEGNITDLLHNNRNFGIDFAEIKQLTAREINIDIQVQFAAGADVKAVSEQLYRALDEFLLPRSQFYSFDELSEEGERTEDIFLGPVLQHGFVKNEEPGQLERSYEKREIYRADIIELIYKNPQIKVLESISVTVCTEDGGAMPKDDGSGVIVIQDDNGSGSIVIPGEVKINNSVISCPAPDRVDKNRALKVPVGKYRNLQEYTLIQDELPSNYIGIRNSDDNQRQAQVKQLRAYMLFFDKILGDYFAQLGGIASLFNFNKHSVLKTYFAHDFADREDVESLFNSSSGKLNIALDTDQRKTKLLDHLLAMFGESFPDKYALGKTRLDNSLSDIKIRWLRECPETGKMRANGGNYTDEKFVNADTVLKKRIADILCLPEAERNKFFIVDHILLRYRDRSDKGQHIIDFLGYNPYSCRISFIFDASLFNKDKIDTVRSIIEREVTAHLKVNVRFIKEFGEFTNMYRAWHKALLENNNADAIKNARSILEFCEEETLSGIGIMQIEAEDGEEEFKIGG